MRSSRSLQVWKLGTLNYLEALKFQEKLVADRKASKIPDTLLSLQHPPTYTLGKRRTDHNLLIPASELQKLGAELHYTQRGGDITYHGPCQAILYPIISLRDIGLGVRNYVEKLELTMIELALLYGVGACPGQKGETGVWVGNRKIGAIGLRISSGITSHGLAFNIDPDLNYFKNIVPCGIVDKEITSLRRETEPEPEPKTKPLARTEFNTVLPPSKRPKPNNPLNFPSEAPIPGRYISKRERALMGAHHPTSDPIVQDPNPNPYFTTTSVLASIDDSEIPRDLLSSLRRVKGRAQLKKIPERLFTTLRSHTKAVNALSWSQSDAHLLASAGMDHTICVWNVWSRGQKLARIFRFHNAAVKDVKWSHQGLSVLSCGYDSASRLIDVEKGIETQVFKEDQVVGVIKFHSDNSNLFLSGGSKGRIRLWDIRTRNVAGEYIRGLGPILDLEFSNDGKHFISSSDVTGTNASENSIIVWDVSRQVPLSNQVYVEAYTCPCIRCHPVDPCFVAQSNGNYIAIFSSSPPFRLDKYKRFESHGVSGFPIKCNFNLDGEILVSGSSDGSIYFYNYRSSDLVKKIWAYEQACIDVAFHPVMPNVIASCSWNGEVSVFE